MRVILVLNNKRIVPRIDRINLALDYTQPIAGSVTVEPRTIGAGHVVVFQFDGPVTVAGSATTVDSNNVSIATATTAGAVANEVLVTLTGVADRSRARISLTGVNGAATVWPASIGFLVSSYRYNKAQIRGQNFTRSWAKVLIMPSRQLN